MDRYNDVKILLKKWEQSFFQTNNRKPNKVSGIVIVCYAISGFLVLCFILLCYVLSLMFFNVMLFCVFLCCLLIYVIVIVGIFCH